MSAITIATLWAVEEPAPSEPIVPICEHIKDNGIRCGTPSIRGRHFCYYHSRAHRPRVLVGDRDYRAPIPESTEALQITVAHVLRALGSDRLHHKVANSMFYGLHLAAKILRMSQPVPAVEQAKIVRDIPPAMQGILRNRPIPEPADTDPAYIQELVDSLLSLDQIEENYVTIRKGESDYYYSACMQRVAAHHAAVKKLDDLGLFEKYRTRIMPESAWGSPGPSSDASEEAEPEKS